MKLTLKQIRSITVGAIRVEQEADGICFYRLTKKQLAAWQNRNTVFYQNAMATTGVRLDFHTNSSFVAFRASGGQRFEIYVNGLLRTQVYTEAHPDVHVALCDPLGDALVGDRRVTVYFPSHNDPGALEYVELDDGATLTPHRFDRKFLFIGDSITQGYNTDYDSLSFAYRVSRFYNAESLIQGIGGTYYWEDAFDHLPFEPDAVFVAYGTNDFGYYKTLDELREHAAAHLHLIAEEYAGKPIVVITPIWRDKREGRAMGSFADCRKTIAEEAARLHLNCIDGLSLVPPLPTFFKDEYLHPNDNGFSLYAENLIMLLQERNWI